MDMRPRIGIADYLNDLHRRGARLTEQDGKLRYAAPRGVLGEGELKELAARKAQILPLLRQRTDAPEEELPLAAGQRALWLLNARQPDSAAYNVAAAVARLRGPVSGERVQDLYQTLLNRHPALRAVFPLAEGRPTQRIQPFQELDFRELEAPGDEAALARQVRDAYRQPFDLVGGPLLRVRLLRRSATEAVLLATAHHIVLDGWSVGRLSEEALALLENPLAAPPPPGAGHHEFIRWQQTWLAGPEAARDLAYWRELLAGEPPVLALPDTGGDSSDAADSVPFTLAPAVLAALRRLARREHCSLFSLLLAAFQVLLHRHSGQDDILTGTPAAARPRAEFHASVGMFTNPLAIRGDLSGNPPFSQFLAQIQAKVLGALAHQNLPFSELAAALPGWRGREAPLQASFVLHAARLLGEQSGLLGFAESGHALRAGDLELEAYALAQQEGQFDLVLELAEGRETLPGYLKFNARRHARAAMQRMAGHYAVLLQGVAADPDCPLAELPLLSAAELARDAMWNATARDFPGARTLHGLVAEAAARHGEAPALAWGGQVITYAGLQSRAAALAAGLAHLELPAASPLGVCLPPGPGRIVALLAVLQAGHAYLPLDPDYPAERLEFMATDAACAAILCDAQTRETLAGVAARLADPETLADTSSSPPPPRDDADAIAYVIHTSGSTGRPKGVPIRHKSAVNLARAQIEAFDVRPESRVLQFAAFSFDASISEIFMALGAGACLLVEPRAAMTPGAELWQTLRERGVSHLTLPPSALSVLPREPLPDLAALIVAGEACPAELAAHWRRDRAFYNAYGPTETAVCATIQECSGLALDAAPPPIGRPIANVQCHVLNAALQPVPLGVTGELCIGGVGLSPGYLNRAADTAARFPSSPFRPGARLYRSGDLVRRREDGALEFLGRRDHQVKVRGFRIEPGEVEAALLTLPGAAEAAVLALPGPDGLPRLEAFIRVTRREDFPRHPRGLLEGRLPAHMRPSAYTLLERFPLTPAGKVDRAALAAMPRGAGATETPREPPRNALERTLAEIWSRLLEVEAPGVHDDFFELGGHSLLAASLAAEIETRLGRRLPLESLFQHASIAGLAVLLAEAETAAPAGSRLIDLQTRGGAPTLTLVHALGGDVHAYRELAHGLGGRPVRALRAPGLEPDEPVQDAMESLVDAHLAELLRRQPQGPYLLGGWSMGGVAAHAMASRLIQEGEKLTALVLLDSYPPQALRGYEEATPALTLARDLGAQLGGRMGGQLGRNVDDHAGIDPALLQGDPERACLAVLRRAVRQGLLPRATDEAALARLARVFLANLAALRGYRPPPYAGRVLLLRATDTPGRLPDNGWRAAGCARLSVRAVPGDHFSMMRQPHARTLADLLESALDEEENHD